MMKKKHVWKIIVLACVGILILVTVTMRKQWREKEAMRFVEKMGAGINLGNSLDGKGVRDYWPDAGVQEFETAWGNPVTDEGTFAAIAKAGFKTVRIPVTWMDHMDENGQVSTEWMDRVQEVVDMALNQGLYVILDTHHEEWMNLEVSREEEICQRFQILWEQIAAHFAQYDERLLFESMNEPRLRNSEYEWNAGTPQMRDMVNRLNGIFLETVRGSGENNAERYVLICPYGSSYEKEAMEALTGMDQRTIVSIHMYDPYLFCQKEQGMSTWDDAAGVTRAEIAENFKAIGETFCQKNIPVILTEFGCIDRGNTKERTEWAAYYAELSRQNRMAYIWWDCGGFRLLDRNTKEWVFPKIVQALVQQ